MAINVAILTLRAVILHIETYFRLDRVVLKVHFRAVACCFRHWAF